MRATEFEFNNRFWVIGAIFALGFAPLYQVDNVNFAMGLLHWLAPSLNLDSARGNLWVRLVFAGGALLIFLAALLRTWATAYLRTEVVHDPSIHSEGLVADGPYRRVRNPLYLATLLMTAGLGTMASRLGWVLMLVVMWFFQYRLILREEHGLASTQGESYRAYLRAVPRLWPSLTPRIPAGSTKPKWGPALLGELFFWLFGVALLCFAITLRMAPTLVLIGASLVFYIVLTSWWKRRSTRSAGANPST
jgi:protein-S-isoprenylcysteine O-methyltransferase Ste14